MPHDRTPASSRPIDAVARDAAGAGVVHLRRAAAHLDDLRHQLDLAAACSDLCVVAGASALLRQMEAAIALCRGVASAAIERDAARGRATGIRARSCLPSPTYDHLFRLIAESGRTLCVMAPGHRGYDPDYWEEVPPDAEEREPAPPAAFQARCP
jgi:hypothetical protein